MSVLHYKGKEPRLLIVSIHLFHVKVLRITFVLLTEFLAAEALVTTILKVFLFKF